MEKEDDEVVEIVGDRKGLVLVLQGTKRKAWVKEEEVPAAVLSSYRAEKKAREERTESLSKRPDHLVPVPSTIGLAPLLSSVQRTPGFAQRMSELAQRLTEAVGKEEQAEKSHSNNRQTTATTSVPIGVARFVRVEREDSSMMVLRMTASAESGLATDDCVWLVRKVEDKEEVVVGFVAQFTHNRADPTSFLISVSVPGGELPDAPGSAPWRVLKGDSWPTFAIQWGAIRELRNPACMSMSLQELLVSSSNDAERFAQKRPELSGWLMPKAEEIEPLLKRIGCMFNKSQTRAFQHVISRSLSLVQGPPGTGKTMFGAWLVAALLAHNAKHDCGGPILVTCESNYAVDHFLDVLQKCGVKKIVRLAASKSKVSDSAKQFALQEKEGASYKERRQSREFQIRHASVVLCTNATAAQLAPMRFPIHVLDEAATSSRAR